MPDTSLDTTALTGRPARGRVRHRGRLVGVVLALAVLSGTATACSSSEPALDSQVTLPAEAAAAPGTSYVARPKAEGMISFLSAPDPAAAAVAEIPNPRPLDADPPIPVPLVLLVADQQPGWVQMYLPIRPNGSTGWLPADQVTLSTHPYRIEALLDDFTLRVLKNDQVIYETAIGVSRDNAPTPGGLYYTTELIQPPTDDTVYGRYAYGLSGFSETFNSFNGGAGQLGIHGTNEPDKIGQKVSAGCIRLRNEDITYLVETLKLPVGVPVEIITTGPSTPASTPAG
jgi:lipoprotein-anchoring transpeptidase ErfK/SrfK